MSLTQAQDKFEDTIFEEKNFVVTTNQNQTNTQELPIEKENHSIEPKNKDGATISKI